ncbi:MAG: sigma-70 family RNA polymerase sigma factor [Planctomycetes bacterium]|nr:sigma-70 family RNA polymerase sigma factor [Planctomycetota bacterium]
MPEPFPEALEALILEARGDLIAYLTALSGDRDLADDLFQDACLEAWRAHGRFRAGADFRAWFRGIGRKLLLRRRRRGWLRRSLPFSDELMGAIEGSWSRHQLRQEEDLRREALGACLGELPAERRELLRRRYDDHQSLRQLAADSNRSEDAMKMLFMRLRRLLETCIETKMEHGG